MPWSNYLKGAMQDHLHGGPTFTRPATTYFAFMIVAPLADGTGGTESSLTRVAFTNNSTNWPPSAGAVKTNAVAIDFGIMTGSLSGEDIAEYDASTGGNLLAFGVAGSITVSAGQRLVVAIGDADFTTI